MGLGARGTVHVDARRLLSVGGLCPNAAGHDIILVFSVCLSLREGDAGKAGLRHAPSITFHQKLNNIEEIERGQSRTRMPDERTLYEHLISCLFMRVVK